MVLAKTDKSIISIRGRHGGVYFKKSPDGQHIQSMPRIVHYTRSGLQGAFVSQYTGMSALWHLALVAFFGAAWATFALIHWFRKPGQEPKKITGFMWYVHYGMRFPETESPAFWKPPHSPGDLPSYIVTSGTHGHFEHAPPDWADDYPGGYFWPKFPWNEKLFYGTDDGNWSIWWKDPMWVVSPSPGFEPADKTYYSTNDDITDWYQNPVTKKYIHVYIGKPEEP